MSKIMFSDDGLRAGWRKVAIGWMKVAMDEGGYGPR